MSFVDFALGLAGVPDQTIADLDKAYPGMARLAALAKQAEPDLTAAKPHIDALQPIVARLWPLAQKAWPDIVAVTPTVDELLAFVAAKQAGQ